MKRVVEAIFEDPARPHGVWNVVFVNEDVYRKAIAIIREGYDIPEGDDRMGRCADLDVIETPSEFVALYDNKVREKALNKLNDAEKRLLGLIVP